MINAISALLLLIKQLSLTNTVNPVSSPMGDGSSGVELPLLVKENTGY